MKSTTTDVSVLDVGMFGLFQVHRLGLHFFLNDEGRAEGEE